jgi:hypothetical protein
MGSGEASIPTGRLNGGPLASVCGGILPGVALCGVGLFVVRVRAIRCADSLSVQAARAARSQIRQPGGDAALLPCARPGLTLSLKAPPRFPGPPVPTSGVTPSSQKGFQSPWTWAAMGEPEAADVLGVRVLDE